jgi:hypothetical protein
VASPAAAKPLLGVRGNLSRFDALTGQHSRAGEAIVGWGQGATWGGSFEQLFATLGETPVLGISAKNRSGNEAITPLAVARGKGDGYLFAVNAAVARWGRPIYVRPFFEMNGFWTSYCAFTRAGRAKNAAHSTATFRKAFARIYLLVHGGTAAEVSVKLRRLGLPGISHDLAVNPFPVVRVIWNPQGYSVPQLAANSPQAYYPGDAYVDVVGNDLVEERGDVPKWAANDALYAAHPSKPYAFPEWGLQSLDDPAFVRRMASFVRGHRRVELLVYTNGPPGSIFDLGRKPRSRAAYRAAIAPLGR